MQPTVSVCLPVLDMGDWLRECIASVRAQTFTDWEMVIVDDGSTQDIRAIVESFADERLRYIRLEQNQGVTKAANVAFRAARGRYISPLAADEWIAPNKLSEQVAIMDAEPSLAAVFGLPEQHELEGPAKGDLYSLWSYNRGRPEWLQTILSGEKLSISTASSLWRRDVVEGLGYYDESFRITCDLELYVRIFAKHEVRFYEKKWGGGRIRTDGKQVSGMNQKNSQLFREEMALIHQKHGSRERPKSGYTGKVVIVTPFRQGEGHSAYISSLVATTTVMERLGIKWDYWPMDGFSYIDQARDLACARFLEDAEATDLVFIDSDHSWGTMGFLRLLIAPADVVGGSYMVKNDWNRWTAQEALDKDGDRVGIPTSDGGALIEALSLPAGFLRITRKALLKFRDAYHNLRYRDPAADISARDREYTSFFERVREDGMKYGEDVTFSRRWRDLGEKLYIEPRIDITHYGVKGWFGNLDGYLRSLKQSEAA